MEVGPATAVEPPAAIVETGDCLQHEIPANDDQYSPEVALPFGINFYGQDFEHLWVNNNGNVTFDGPLGTYTPFGLTGTGARIIAPFFADVDTRARADRDLRWGNTTYEGHRAFCANWINVGYYAGHTDKTNSFQLCSCSARTPGPGRLRHRLQLRARGVGDRGRQWWGRRPGRLLGPRRLLQRLGRRRDVLRARRLGRQRRAARRKPATGLTNYMTTSTLNNTTRWCPAARLPGAKRRAPLTNYVALGDSYQSGRAPWIPRRHRHRHRTSATVVHAYPQRLVDLGVVNLTLDFGACSGAKT